MTVRETSIRTYYEILEEGLLGEGQEEVYKAIKDLGEATDVEVMQYLGYSDPNKVRPRRKELLDMHIIKDGGTRECKVTGRTVHQWKVLEEANYMSLQKVKRVKCPMCKGKGHVVKPQTKLASWTDKSKGELEIEVCE